MRIIRESLVCPLEGIFWYIDRSIVALSQDVSYRDYKNDFNYEHKDLWAKIADDYLVDGKQVPFNYYPRGRVMVEPVFDDKGFRNYWVQVVLDHCLDNPEIEQQIIDAFNLDLPSCDEPMFWYEKEHYNCINCRGE